MHNSFGYTKNFIGVLMAIMSQPNPVSQEEIMEITSYGRSTVSQTISQLLMSKLVTQLKSREDRIKRYSPLFSIQNLLLNIIKQTVIFLEKSIQYIPNLLKRLDALNSSHPSANRFKELLERLLHLCTSFLLILDENQPTFSETISITQSNRPIIKSAETLHQYDENRNSNSKLKNLHFGPKSTNNPKKYLILPSDTITIGDEQQQSQELIELKHNFIEYIESISTRFGIQYGLSLVIFSIIIESIPVSQDFLMKITGLQRSIISDSLQKLEALYLVEKVKRKNDRKKYYISKIDLETIVWYKFAFINEYVSQTLNLVSKLKDQIAFLLDQKNLDSNDKDFNNAKSEIYLYQFFNKILFIYEKFGDFFKNVAAEYNKISKTNA